LPVSLGALRSVAFEALRADLVGDNIGGVFLRRSGEDPNPGQRGQRRKQQRHASSHGGRHDCRRGKRGDGQLFMLDSSVSSFLAGKPSTRKASRIPAFEVQTLVRHPGVVGWFGPFVGKILA
jgi:hypothetical protein